MRFLFVTVASHESRFYGRVGSALVEHGHEVAYVTTSRHSAELLRARGLEAVVVQDLVSEARAAADAEDPDELAARYGFTTIRDAYRADPACRGKPEDWCVERSVAHVRALERCLDALAPDVVVPEVGRETVRVVTHAVARERGIPVLFLFYTIFPNPLRLYVDTMHAPIVPAEELRPLAAEERAELEAFRRAFTARAEPIRRHRRVSLHPRRLVSWAEFASRKLRYERDNEYFRPLALLRQEVAVMVRAKAARLLYGKRDPARPFVYFPLHVTDDYKIELLIPHCADQASIVEQLADALPPGYDLVLKEHPLAIGRNPLSFLRRLRRRPNVRLVDPFESSHDLIRAADAVAVISSTVGLEALLYEKPVLTLGQPFYAGFGVTLDLDSFREIREGVPALLRFRPDPERVSRFLHAAMRSCYPGAPVSVSDSDENARLLAESIDRAGRAAVADRPGAAPQVGVLP
jgi:hypothetical protein